MKHATKLPSRATSWSSSSSAMAPHRCSHAIAKAPPRKIRIVHVLAPEIIKTDARHFRDLVQRLTGKPAPSGAAASESAASLPDSCDTASEEAVAAGAEGRASERPEVKEEAEASSGGFLRALKEEDNNDAFFQGLEDFQFLEHGRWF